MKKLTLLTSLLAALVVILTLSGCSASFTPADDSASDDAKVKFVVAANNQFAYDYYNQLSTKEAGNILFSPWSISTALAMTYEGARGQTASEMQQVMHYPDAKTRLPAYAYLYNKMNKKDKEYQLYTANALWAEQQYVFLDSYFNITDRYYKAKVTNLDFRTQPGKSTNIINKWVEEQTNDRIKGLISPNSITGDTRLVLTNAIYFKGNWLHQFKKSSTIDMDFEISPGQAKKVPMMRQKEKFNYTETDKLQVLEMPYKGEELSMLILLPKDRNLQSAEEALTLADMDDIRSSLRKQEVTVTFPKFIFDTKYDMKTDLWNMGMQTAFTNSADFSGMDGTQQLFIQFVVHQAFIEVNEEGTEAAAATAVGMGEKMAAPVTTFIADHPFIFMIQDIETGNILFIGRMNDPSE